MVSRRGDPVAGQVWVEIDHLDGTVSLFTPAPSLLQNDDEGQWLFVSRFYRENREIVAERIQQESTFDPDFWLLTLESRSDDHGLNLAEA